jgi:hypothetical protein
VRRWDVARAAKAEKVGFGAGIEGYFFIFGFGGGARAGGIWDFGGAGGWQAGCNVRGRRTESSRPFRPFQRPIGRGAASESHGPFRPAAPLQCVVIPLSARPHIRGTDPVCREDRIRTQDNIPMRGVAL